MSFEATREQQPEQETKQAAEADEGDEDVEADDSEEVACLEAKLEEKRELLRAYQRLTGIALSLPDTGNDDDEDDDDTLTVQCTAINHIHKRVVKFDLLLPVGPSSSKASSGKEPVNDATFIPTANKQLLPEDMRAPLRFDGQQLPILTQKLLKKLYAK